jgi:hypothetical protein
MTVRPTHNTPASADTDPGDLDPLVVPRVTLPKNLEATLTRLADGELFSLQAYVEKEIRRRAPTKARAPVEARARSNPKSAYMEPVPLAKRSLIQASSRTGMKPHAIAKTLRLPLSLVTRVLADKDNAR